MRRILVIAAHPDDEILGCGGFLHTCKQHGIRTRVAILGEGTSARFHSTQMESAEALEAKRIRTEDSVRALALIQVEEYEFHDLPCGRFDQVPIVEIGKMVEREIAAFKPDILLTHALIDVNNDHQRTHQAVMQATRPNVLNQVSEVLAFETPSSTEWRFTSVFAPTVFVPLDDRAVEAKIAALETYTSEVRAFPFPRSREGVITTAMYRGMQAGVRYAEAFQPIRMIRSIADLAG